MKAVLSLLIILSFLNSFSQDTTFFDKNWKKTSKSNAAYYGLQIEDAKGIKIMDYYLDGTLQMSGYTRSVTKGDFKDSYIRNGMFTYYEKNGKIKSRGLYRNDKKTGEWQEFYPEGQLYFTQTFDKKSRIVGNFTIYYPDGKTRRSDFYSKGEFQNGKCFTASGSDTTWFPYRISAEYPGGEVARQRFLAENCVYPKEALNQGIRGTVYISFVISSKGDVEEVTLLKGVSKSIDDEALRVVKMMPRWKPGMQDGKSARVVFNMPVYFKLIR